MPLEAATVSGKQECKPIGLLVKTKSQEIGSSSLTLAHMYKDTPKFSNKCAINQTGFRYNFGRNLH